MKIKRIVIITLAVSLLLVGTVALAADDESSVVNTQSRGSFAKSESVCDEDGNMIAREGNRGGERMQNFMDSEAFVEYSASLQAEFDEVFATLVSNDVLTQEEVDSIPSFERGKGIKIEEVLTDLTDEECDAIEAAMVEVHEYMGTLKAELSEAGLIGASPRMSLDGSNKGGGARGRQN